MQGEAPATRAAASDLISSLRDSRPGREDGRPDPQGPASEGQLQYLQVGTVQQYQISCSTKTAVPVPMAGVH